MCNGAKIINPRAFLFAIAHHLIIDWYRKKKTVSIEEDEESETGLCDYISNESYLDIESKAEARHLIETLKKNTSAKQAGFVFALCRGSFPARDW